MSFVDSLRDEAEKQRFEWADRAAMIAQLTADQQRQRVYIEQLNPLLVAHGISPIDVIDKPSRAGGRGFAQPGNRPGANVPPRRESFRSVSLPEAIRTILADGKAMHSTEMVPLIYEVSRADVELFHNANRSLVGTLAEGVHKGWWDRTAPNTYRLKRENGNGHKESAAAEVARV